MASLLIFPFRGTYISLEMKDRFRPRVLLFIIFAVWTTGSLYAMSYSVGGAAALGIGAGQGFGPKLQGGGSGSIGIGIPLLEWLSIDPGIDYAYVAASDVSGGFAYRGFQSGALSVMLEARAPIAASADFGRLLGGAALGGAASFSIYNDTTLFFFFPEVRLSPFLEWQPAFLPSFGLLLALPAKVQFRRDMTWSVAAGLELDIVYTTGGTK